MAKSEQGPFDVRMSRLQDRQCQKRAHARALRGTQSSVLEVIEHEPLACDAAGTTIMAQGSGGAVPEAARGWKRPLDDVGIFEICRFSLITQRIHTE